LLAQTSGYNKNQNQEGKEIFLSYNDGPGDEEIIY